MGDVARERLVRLIAVGNRMRIPATETGFRAELERIVELAAIAPELRPGGARANG